MNENEKRKIIQARKELIHLLKKCQKKKYERHLDLEIDSETLRNVIFENNHLAISMDLLKYVNLSGVDWRGISVKGLDFTGTKGVKINPQTVYERNFSGTKLNNVFISGPFDNVFIVGCDFTGARGMRRIVIDPQTIRYKDLTDCKFNGVTFVGSFNNTMIHGSDFTGSSGAVINPQKIEDKDLTNAKFSGVRFNGSFRNIAIVGSDFTNSYGAVIRPRRIYKKNLMYTILTDTNIVGSFRNVRVNNTDFSGSTGAVIKPKKVYNSDLLNCKFKDTIIKGSLDKVAIVGSDFTGSTGAELSAVYIARSHANLTDVYIEGQINKTNQINVNQDKEENIDKAIKNIKRLNINLKMNDKNTSHKC